jgi:NAD(P)-dependent dehydrogenase (short-subunit alcohol dehydrogenase family)
MTCLSAFGGPHFLSYLSVLNLLLWALMPDIPPENNGSKPSTSTSSSSSHPTAHGPRRHHHHLRLSETLRRPQMSTKGAIVAFTRAISSQQIGNGIRVNAVCPGPSESPIS